MRWAVVVLVVLAPLTEALAESRSERRARIDHAVGQLPVIDTLEGGRTPITVRGDLSRRDQRRAMRMARNVYHDFNKRFARPLAKGERTRPAVDLCIIRTARQYWRFVKGIYGPGDHAGYGFYMPRDRLVVINWAWSTNNLRHEIMHPLLNDDFPAIPSWLNEGLSSLHTSMRYRRGVAHYRDNFRLRYVKRAVRKHRLPTWRQLARSSRGHVYGSRQQTYYSTSRYVLFYLSRQDKLAEFYKAVRDAGADRRTHQSLLEHYVDRRAFVRFIRRR